METTRYFLNIDATTDDAIDTFLRDAHAVDTSPTNVTLDNPNDYGFPVVAFDMTADDAARYARAYDCDLD